MSNRTSGPSDVHPLITGKAKEWIGESNYRTVSTGSLIHQMDKVRRNIVHMLKSKTTSPMLSIMLQAAELYNPYEGKTVADKRQIVKKYITNSSSFWYKIDWRTPAKSVKAILDSLQSELSIDQSLIDELSFAVDANDKDTLEKACTDVQILISMTVFYIHVKRNPSEHHSQHIVYGNPNYCHTVNIDEWSAKYSMTLSGRHI